MRLSVTIVGKHNCLLACMTNTTVKEEYDHNGLKVFLQKIYKTIVWKQIDC